VAAGLWYGGLSMISVVPLASAAFALITGSHGTEAAVVGAAGVLGGLTAATADISKSFNW
jgi:hypothetical protein